jgi:hypothetical protein
MSITNTSSNAFVATQQPEVTLSDNRLAKVFRATSLSEAKEMGLIDRIADAIEHLYEQITSAENSVASPGPARRLAGFETLKAWAGPEHADKFKVGVALDQGVGKWSFDLKIDEQAIVSQSEIDFETGHDFVAFQDAVLLDAFAAAVRQTPRPENEKIITDLREQMAGMNADSSRPIRPDAEAARKFIAISAAMPLDGPPCQITFGDRSGSVAMPSGESYSLLIDEVPIHGNQFTVGTNAHQRPEVAAAAILADVAHISNRSREILQDREFFIQANVESAADSQADRNALLEHRHDKNFNSSTFKGARVVADDPSKFIATFGDKELTLSNRAPTKGELRGEPMMRALRDTHYDNLNDVFAIGHLGPTDAMMLVAYSPSSGMLQALSQDVLDPRETLQVKQTLADIPLGNTTLGKLWRLETTAPADPFDIPEPGFDLEFKWVNTLTPASDPNPPQALDAPHIALPAYA